jgi:exopolysaccharide biosynthesis polyprenyl glycosylphosphotransferase
MKRSELIFNFVSIPVDALMLLAAGMASFYIRLHSTNLVGQILYNLQLDSFLRIVYLVTPVLLLIFAALGLYNQKGTRHFSQELWRIMIGVSLGLFLVIVLFFFKQNLFPSRFIILASWVCGIIFVLIGRFILRRIQNLRFKSGYGLHKLVIINGSNHESKVIQGMLNNRGYGYQVVADLHYSTDIMPVLENLHANGVIDEIMQTNPSISDEANLQLVEFARSRGLQFSFVPNLFEAQRNSVEVTDYSGVPVISLKNTPLDGWGKVAKRALDVIVSAVCLIILSPVFLAIYLAVKLNSKGPAIYGAMRGGRGADFRFYKFRTMHAHLSVGDGYGGEAAEKLRRELWKKNNRGGEQGPFLKIKDDPRVTGLGKFLRRSKLDEIPQFWNVLKGDMSMVGPRDEVERYRARYQRMFSIKPGIFGMSQLAQVASPDLPFEEEIRLNTYYIENWSLWLDVIILAKTFYLLIFADKPHDNY